MLFRSLIALVLVVIVSLLPLSRWTGGRVKDFSLFSDILREVGIIEHTDPSQEQIDPALLEAMEESKDPREAPDSVLAQPIDTIIQAPRPARQGELVVIEDYTTHESGLMWFKDALASGSTARVAVVGDSWIEGDIFKIGRAHV